MSKSNRERIMEYREREERLKKYAKMKSPCLEGRLRHWFREPKTRSLTPDLKCKWCGKTVAQVKAEQRRRQHNETLKLDCTDYPCELVEINGGCNPKCPYQQETRAQSEQTEMRYFRARQYVHASIDGVKSLCGLQCNTFGCHWESDLWREVKAADFDYSPCLKCKKSKQLPKQLHVVGKQTILQETTTQ